MPMPETTKLKRTILASIITLTIAAMTHSAAGSEAVRCVQSELTALGHDPGPIDGDMGRRTASALLTSLAPSAANAASAIELRRQLASIISEERLLQFLVDEAVRSKVAKINIVTKAAMNRRCPSAVYGCATWQPGKRRAELYLASDVAGGTDLINITHELSHAAVYRSGCLGHGKRWIDYWAEVAARFEQQFPGRKWGASTPSQAVEARRVRYASEMSRC
jgi:hypothetical protein